MLNYNDSDMPMRLCNIPKFERANPTLSINVIKYNACMDDEVGEGEVVRNEAYDLVYKTGNKNAIHKINLLLLEEKGNFHYVAITNLSRLLNTHSGTHRVRNIWCESCLRGFRKQAAYAKHLTLCQSMSKQLTVYSFPDEPTLKFRDWSKAISPQFVVYADFESTLESTADESHVEKHLPIAAAFVLLSEDAAPKYYSFFGSQCVVEFLQTLEGIARDVKLWYDQNSKKEMLHYDEEAFKQATICYLCKQNPPEVRDHDHFTGTYLGAACNDCNLARRLPRLPFLPVVFHNLRGYDMHHILKHAVSKFPSWSLNCIPQSTEQFLSLTAYIDKCASLRFIDSLRFLNSSLDTLVKTLSQKPLTEALTDIPNIAKTSKGIFPYSLASSCAALEEKRDELPEMVLFKDSLSGQVKVSKEEHDKASQIWHECNCKSLKDYMLVYLKLDVFLLADVFESFRRTGIAEDGLDPANFFSIPGLSWASALKNMSEQGYELELLQDSTMYEFFEAGVRGGMTFVNKHYVPNDVDNDALLYIDINNLYGWALSQRLPTSEFEWLKRIPTLEEMLPADDADYGYIFEVDMEVPAHLHNYLSDLPPAPMMQKPPGSNVNKLLLTLEHKTHYIIHYALLKFYLSIGVRVTTVHRAIRFRQEAIFKSYIDYNTTKRAATTCKFAKDYYKLKNNSLFGKTVENLRKRLNLRLCNSEEKLVTYASKATFKRSLMIDEGLVAAILQKDSICLDRPVYVGQAVLDISKLRMYKLQYVELEKYRKQFACEIAIVAGDTDSFFLACKGVSVSRELLPAMKADGLLDTSNFPHEHTLYSSENANKIGLFKDESGAAIVYKEWIFLRPKCYSLLSDKNVASKKAKGVVRSVVSNEITHRDYKRIYESTLPTVEEEEEDGPSQPSKVMRVTQSRIGSVNHQLYTITTTKVALSAKDDKRCWLSANKSLPYGHHSIHQ